MFHLFKLSGAGNTFYLMDLYSPVMNRKTRSNNFAPVKLTTNQRRDLAIKTCSQNSKSSADGLIFLEISKKSDLKWDFYNSDGSRAEMCGNAARCVGLFASTYFANAKFKKSFNLETRAGNILISLIKNKIKNSPRLFKVKMPKIRNYKKCFLQSIGTFDFVNSGVPHAVVCIPRAKKMINLTRSKPVLNKITLEIRKMKSFLKAGVNVTFYCSKSSQDKIYSLTYERGVSGYTQACGTGAVAAAYCYSKTKPFIKRTARGAKKIYEVQAPGGILKVDLSNSRPFLIGPAIFIKN
ncbi:MAG: diaminopimelate epimerase [Bdellovibrionales bacterium]